MYSRLGLSALAATAVSAIMIPPNGDIGGDGTFTIAVPDNFKPLQTFGVDPYTQIVKVPCPGCPFAQFGEKGVSWTREQENYLVLNISVGAKPQTLEMNGVQIFPPSLAFSAEPEVLQIPADVSLDDIRGYSRVAAPAQSLRLTSWGLQASGVHTSKETGEEVLNLHLQIHALEQRPVQIPEVVVTAVKDRKAELLLIKTQVSHKPYSPQSSQKECKNWPMLCKWKAIVASRLEAMRNKFKGKGGCHKRPGFGMSRHGKKPHQSKPHHLPHPPADKPHRGRPHRRPHHHHHHHHKSHPIMNKIARVLLTIVIPLLVGILAGMLTYLLGMLVGTGIALLWMRIRSRRQQYSQVALEDGDEVESRESLEKGEFSEDEYMDVPPVYVEVEAKEVGQI